MEMIMIKWQRLKQNYQSWHWVEWQRWAQDAYTQRMAITQPRHGVIGNGGQKRLPEGGGSWHGVEKQVASWTKASLLWQRGLYNRSQPKWGHRLWLSSTDPTILVPEFPLSPSLEWTLPIMVDRELKSSFISFLFIHLFKQLINFGRFPEWF